MSDLPQTMFELYHVHVHYWHIEILVLIFPKWHLAAIRVSFVFSIRISSNQLPYEPSPLLLEFRLQAFAQNVDSSQFPSFDRWSQSVGGWHPLDHRHLPTSCLLLEAPSVCIINYGDNGVTK